MLSDRLIFGVYCHCHRKTCNLRQRCNHCLDRRVCPPGHRSPSQATYGHFVTTPAGLELPGDSQTNEAADAERARRVEAFCWWLETHSRLPSDWGRAVQKYEAHLAAAAVA